MQDAIISGAKTAFLQGDQWAYTAGLVAVLLGATLVYFVFPKKQHEEELLARYHAEDAARAKEPSAPSHGDLGLPAPGGP
jgi:hypothetical protein